MRVRVLIVVALVSSVAGASAQAGTAAARQFISISDIHFNPYYDPTLMQQLEASDVSGWAAIFQSSKIQQPNSYNSDTNYSLFASFLADLKTRAADATFATISGDFLCHDFPQDFQLYSPDKSEGAYQSFVTKTVQFIATELRAADPGLTIYPALGNNDSDCGDYEITPKGWFLGVFAKAFAPSVKWPGFVTQFSPYGYYAAPAPMPDTTLIGLNTIFFSSNYDNACGTNGIDYGVLELAWLKKQLALARLRKRHVWLLYHIPPGINVYSSTTGPSACPAPVTMWKTQYTTTFDALMKQYASTVSVSLAGHTHMDDFRLMATTTSPFAYVHITPAVSPLFTNNPAYEVMTYLPQKATIADYAVIHFTLNTPTPRWGQEYSFDSAYGQTSYTPQSIAAVRAAIDSDPATRALYIRYYTASNPGSTTITPETSKGYWCGTGARTPADFSNCYCVTPASP